MIAERLSSRKRRLVFCPTGKYDQARLTSCSTSSSSSRSMRYWEKMTSFSFLLMQLCRMCWTAQALAVVPCPKALPSFSRSSATDSSCRTATAKTRHWSGPCVLDSIEMDLDVTHLTSCAPWMSSAPLTVPNHLCCFLRLPRGFKAKCSTVTNSRR